MGPNHIDARLGGQCNYGVLDPLFGAHPPDPGSGVWDPRSRGLGDVGSQHPRWRYGETGVWGLGASPQTPYPGFTVSPTRMLGLAMLLQLHSSCWGYAAATLLHSPGPAGPRGNNTIKGLANAAAHVSRDGPSHRTRARIMCARARARAPAE